FPLTFVSYSPPSQPLGTALFDGNNVPLSATLQSGSINIAPVPEPAAWLLALAAVLCGATFARKPHTTTQMVKNSDARI
ncbi:MAG TPA: PEP-CTERM sorting domain-containing protein, partial [Pirellulales bacterium]